MTMSSSNDSDIFDNEEKPSLNREINYDGFSLRVSNPSACREPSIDDERDGGDDGDGDIDLKDDEASDDNERGRKSMRRKRTDFEWLCMVALQKRLRKKLKLIY